MAPCTFFGGESRIPNVWWNDAQRNANLNRIANGWNGNAWFAFVRYSLRSSAPRCGTEVLLSCGRTGSGLLAPALRGCALKPLGFNISVLGNSRLRVAIARYGEATARSPSPLPSDSKMRKIIKPL